MFKLFVRIENSLNKLAELFLHQNNLVISDLNLGLLVFKIMNVLIHFISFYGGNQS